MGRYIAAAVAACVLAAGIAAMAAKGAGSPYDFAVGAGKGVAVFGGEFPFQFTLSAHDGPQGPSGTFTVHDPDIGTFTVDVQCIQVIGNRAVVAGPLRRPVEESGITFLYAKLDVEDNGEPSGSTPDRADPVLLFPSSFERVCSGTAPLSTFLFPLDQGNVVVYDAP